MKKNQFQEGVNLINREINSAIKQKDEGKRKQHGKYLEDIRDKVQDKKWNRYIKYVGNQWKTSKEKKSKLS